MAIATLRGREVFVDPALATPSNYLDDAIEAAIASFSSSNNLGGTVVLPKGTWKISRPIELDRGIVLRGQGGYRAFYGTELVVDSGVTGLEVKGVYVGSGGEGSVIENIAFTAAGKNVATTTGSYTAPSYTITVASSSGFSIGQYVRLAGAGPSAIMQRVRADTTAGMNTITAIPLETTVHGFIARDTANGIMGTTVQVAGAGFPAGTYVTNVSGNTITLSQNATNTVNNAEVTTYEDLWARIENIVGTTWTIENNGTAHTSVTNALLMHADHGISLKTRATIKNCNFDSFQGNGIHIRASTGDSPQSNANVWRVENCRSIGCANGMYISGVDANAGTAVALDVQLNREWGMIDASALGNTFVGAHSAGGKGYRTITESIQYSNFSGCYVEGGTYCSFTPSTMVLGGTMNVDYWGGSCLTTQANRLTANALQVGLTTGSGSFSDLSITFQPYGPRSLLAGQHPTLWQLRADTAVWPSSVSIDFRKSRAANGDTGWYTYVPNNDFGLAPYAFSDADASVGAGQMWLMRGFYIGGDAGPSFFDFANRRKIALKPSVPASGTWEQGDFVFNNTPTEVGLTNGKYTLLGWRCVSSGTPGTWSEVRGLTENATKVHVGVASVSDSLLTTTSPTSVVTYTPTTQGNYFIHIYYRVVTATTNLTLEVSYTDGTGAQTVTLLGPADQAVDSYRMQSAFINATASAITVTATAGTANQVYVSATITGGM